MRKQYSPKLDPRTKVPTVDVSSILVDEVQKIVRSVRARVRVRVKSALGTVIVRKKVREGCYYYN